MPRFFINSENITEDRIQITKKSDIIHITKVLRHKKNDLLVLSDTENTVYEAEIMSINPDMIEAKITDRYYSDKKLLINITLAQSIIKSQKQDYVIQKATELGVRTIIPFTSKNTVVKFDSEKDKLQKVHRWQKIVHESAKQCQRGDLAEVLPVGSFKDILNLENFDIKIVCSEKESSLSIKQALQANTDLCLCGKNLNILLVIGPEGGWDDSEISALIKEGFASVTLGKLIYRAETAVVAAISHIIYECEL